jgi:hypothetical protein
MGSRTGAISAKRDFHAVAYEMLRASGREGNPYTHPEMDRQHTHAHAHVHAYAHVRVHAKPG